MFRKLSRPRFENQGDCYEGNIFAQLEDLGNGVAIEK